MQASGRLLRAAACSCTSHCKPQQHNQEWTRSRPEHGATGRALLMRHAGRAFAARRARIADSARGRRGGAREPRIVAGPRQQRRARRLGRRGLEARRGARRRAGGHDRRGAGRLLARLAAARAAAGAARWPHRATPAGQQHHLAATRAWLHVIRVG